MEKNRGDDSRSKGGRKMIVSDSSSSSSSFDSLPEDCISKIISFTSPRDACVVASVSKTFKSAANSDIVWENFLPSEYPSLVPPSRVFSSKKKLYFSLCDDPVLIDDGKKSFWFEKSSGKKCIMLSAMSLSIIWGDTPHHWKWIPSPESIFETVAELIDGCWFEFRGITNIRVLSPRTRYSAYIVFKQVDESDGFGDVAIEAAIGVVGEEPCRRFICYIVFKQVDEFDGFDEDMNGQFLSRDGGRENIVKPKVRDDGWMEIELGEFFNDGGLMNSDKIEMSDLETERLHWKSGLIIQGIEIRPAIIR